MDRVIGSFNYLLALIKADRNEYRSLISTAGPDEVRAILSCIALCTFSPSNKVRKTLREVRRAVTVRVLIDVLRNNQFSVCVVVASVLRMLVEMTIQHVIEGTNEC